MGEKRKYSPSEYIIKIGLDTTLAVALLLSSSLDSNAQSKSQPNPIARELIAVLANNYSIFIDSYGSETIQATAEFESPQVFFTDLHDTNMYTTTVNTSDKEFSIEQSLFELNPDFSEFQVKAQQIEYKKNHEKQSTVRIGQYVERAQYHWSTVGAYPEAHHTKVTVQDGTVKMEVVDIARIVELNAEYQERVSNLHYSAENSSEENTLKFVEGPYYDTQSIVFSTNRIDNLKLRIGTETLDVVQEITVDFGDSIPHAYRGIPITIQLLPTRDYQSALGRITNLITGEQLEFSCLDVDGNGIIEGKETVFEVDPLSYRYFVPSIKKAAEAN